MSVGESDRQTLVPLDLEVDRLVAVIHDHRVPGSEPDRAMPDAVTASTYQTHMTTWNDVESAAPDLAQRVRRRFDATLHKTMATLRRDGSPRISGTEVVFAAGDVWLGSMPNAMKARDLLRDGRCALHSAPVDEKLADGDAKLAGVAVEVTDIGEIRRASVSYTHLTLPTTPYV